MSGANYISEASLSWLSILLRERFGQQVILVSSDKAVRLSLRGSERSIWIASDGGAFSQADSDLPITSWDAEAEGWNSPLHFPLPAPGANSLPSPLIVEDREGLLIRYDILGLAYWMLTRQEEVARTDLDTHNRFAGTSSHAHKHGYLERPIVDEWLNILGQVIARTWPAVEPTKHAFSIRVSHDVDAPSLYGDRAARLVLRSLASDMVRQRRFSGLWQAPAVWMSSKKAISRHDPANTFDWIMDMSERHGLHSAFYFISGRTDHRRDAYYEVGQPSIRHLLRRIHSRGHEIGLHPSYNTYDKPDLIASEFQTLRDVCASEGIEQDRWGGRMHYLRWSHPSTMRAWNDAGLDYDSTLSYADLVGFRCGTCFEYPAFDPVKDEMLRLRIRPLVAMECTVIAQRYMGLGSGDTALGKFLEIREACRKVGGTFTTLWHNSHLIEPAHRRIYQHLLS